ARPGIDVVSLDRRRAVAAIWTASGELQRAKAAHHRILQVRIEERHAVVDFLERAPYIPTQAKVQGQAGTNFEIVLNISRISLIASTGLRDRVLCHAAAIHQSE